MHYQTRRTESKITRAARKKEPLLKMVEVLNRIEKSINVIYNLNPSKTKL